MCPGARCLNLSPLWTPDMAITPYKDYLLLMIERRSEGRVRQASPMQKICFNTQVAKDLRAYVSEAWIVARFIRIIVAAPRINTVLSQKMALTSTVIYKQLASKLHQTPGEYNKTGNCYQHLKHIQIQSPPHIHIHGYLHHITSAFHSPY